MDTSSIILVISCLGIAQALFLCVYLFSLKKGNTRAHLYLGLLILGLTLRIGKSILNEYFHLSPWQRNLGIAGILMVGPSLWLYGKALFHKTFKNKNSIFHFIPYVLFSVLCALIPNRPDTISLVIYYAIFGHLLLYLGFSLALLLGQKKGGHRVMGLWYRNLVFGVGIIWIFYIGNVSGIIPFYIGGALCYTFLVYIFSFLLLRKHTFQLEPYQGQKMDEKVAETILTALKGLFEDESVYLNPKVTLNSVAQSIDTTPKILSRVINETAQVNFSEFVNSYRIKKAKKLLAAPNAQKEKIASIAYDVGFNNVTSFNLAFKAMTHLTPSEFRKRSQ